jgi:hypothetical protein
MWLARPGTSRSSSTWLWTISTSKASTPLSGPSTWCSARSFTSSWIGASAARGAATRSDATGVKPAALNQTELAAEARQLDPDDWSHGHAVAHLAADHPQVRGWPEGNSDLDHRDRIDDHFHPSHERAAEQAFDRLNPTFGIPADQHDPYGRQAVREREAALALGVRVAVHDSRQNDRDPIIWQPGQDYRAADALHAARLQPTRVRWGPERLGPQR